MSGYKKENMRHIINVNLKESPYKIFISEGLSNNISAYIKKLNIGNTCLMVTTPRIYSLYKDIIKIMLRGISHVILRIPDGERSKTQYYLFKIIEEIIKHDRLGEKIFVAAFGGGVVGDLTGLSASLYKRGTPYVQIPTTLLSQIDASIGGKTAIDFAGIKNIVGTFYQPKAVFIDPLFLDTLPKQQIKQGIAEAIKYAIIDNENLFIYLRKNYRKILTRDISYTQRVIYSCAKIKAKIVAEDEKENKSLRTILNFGHTFAHALEATLKFRRLSHGKAVSLGMLYAAYTSLYLKLCKLQDVKAIKTILQLYGLPLQIPFDANTLIERMKYDKKFIHGKIRMVLVSRIGETIIKDNVPLNIIIKSLQPIGAVGVKRLTKR